MHTGWIVAAVVCGVVIAAWVIFHEYGVRSLLLSALQGVAALFAVNLIGMVSGVTLALNSATLGASALLGVPGVIGLLGLRLLTR